MMVVLAAAAPDGSAVAQTLVKITCFKDQNLNDSELTSLWIQGIHLSTGLPAFRCGVTSLHSHTDVCGEQNMEGRRVQ